MLSINDICGVIFDMDGVIFDSEICVIECWKEVAKEYNISGIEAACRRCLGTNATLTKQIFCEIYGKDFDYDYYKDKMRNLFFTRYGDGRLPLKKGIKEILIWLKNNGYKIALATSTRKLSASKELADAGLLEYFDETIYGDMVSKSKPDPEIFLKACSALGLEPSRVAIIEDSFNGIRAANNSGAVSIMVPDLVMPDDEIKKLTDFIFEDLDKVREFLEVNVKVADS